VVYSRIIDGKTYTFGVSGLLHKSNLLLYDHQTDTLWSQLKEMAIAGPLVGKELTKIRSSETKWKDWKKRNPETLVLSTDTGYDRDYSVDPYEGYLRIGGLMFPVGDVRRDLPTKQRVLGIRINDTAKAYSLQDLQKQPGLLKDTVGGETIEIEISKDGEVTEIRDSKGNAINGVFSYWFAWQAFHPDTEVYRPEEKQK